MNPMFIFSQLLPLLVFIIIDSFVKDVRISIISAIVFAIGQMIVTYLRLHQFDWFILVDVALITGLGVISIVLKNDLFFKLKPAVVEGVTILFMLALILASDRFLSGYFSRYMPGTSIGPEAIGMMKTLLGWMCLYVLLHIGAVLYTAYFSSKRVWAIVSGPGFYLVFIPVMIFVLIKALKNRNKPKQQALNRQYSHNAAESINSANSGD